MFLIIIFVCAYVFNQLLVRLYGELYQLCPFNIIDLDLL